MADDIVDLLKIKIEKAKASLPTETLNAIAAVDWRAAILGLRATTGYTFEQLGDLELETELLLCGLVSPENYPKELENRMKISKATANELVNEMNNLVFKKIREELIKNTERKKIFQKSSPPLLNKEGTEGRFLENAPHPSPLLVKERGETLPIPGKLEITGEPARPPEQSGAGGVHPILAQKLSASFQTPTVKTEHSLSNLSSSNTPSSVPKVDPYRELPE